jgi:hypothetical protein
MGLNSDFVRNLTALKKSGKLDGINRVIEIGAQQLTNDLLNSTDATDELFREFGVKPKSLGPPSAFEGRAHSAEILSMDAPSSREMWEHLEFRYSALEFDGHRDSIALDLNHEAVPRKLKGIFDLVVNYGTTEHIANQDNAFRVMHDLARSGGIMMHELPGPGMMTHGMFSYNLPFFWFLCRENGYEVIYLGIHSSPATPIPDNVFACNIEFSGSQHVSVTEVPVFTIRAAFRKTNDKPFVTPLDIPPILKTEKSSGFFGRILK